jgi:hypothetical protein
MTPNPTPVKVNRMAEDARSDTLRMDRVEKPQMAN